MWFHLLSIVRYANVSNILLPPCWCQDRFLIVWRSITLFVTYICNSQPNWVLLCHIWDNQATNRKIDKQIPLNMGSTMWGFSNIPVTHFEQYFWISYVAHRARDELYVIPLLMRNVIDINLVHLLNSHMRCFYDRVANAANHNIVKLV